MNPQEPPEYLAKRQRTELSFWDPTDQAYTKTLLRMSYYENFAVSDAMLPELYCIVLYRIV